MSINYVVTVTAVDYGPTHFEHLADDEPNRSPSVVQFTLTDVWLDNAFDAEYLGNVFRTACKAVLEHRNPSAAQSAVESVIRCGGKLTA